MKQTNINIDEIKRYPTVTNPIKADDLHTPQAYAYTLRRAIVTDCTTEQRAELVELLDGKDTAEGVTFNNTRVNRDRLHIWQNSESRKERAAILGEGWEYVSGLHHHTKPGDLVTCLDGTRGRVTKSDPESCVIEFETEDGRRLSVAGYFRKERNYSTSEKLRAAHEEQKRTFGQAFDAAYYRDVLASLTGKKKVFHFGIPADTVRVEVKRECEGYFRISMKRGESSDVEYFREYIDWETILSTDRAARLLSDYRADHHRAHQFKLGDLVRVNDEKWGQVNGHVGRIVRVVLQNRLVGSYYEVEFVGDLPKFDNGNPMKANNFEPLDIEPVEEITGTEAEGIKVGDTVRHNKHEEVATVTAIREAFVNGCDGYRYLYTLDFGQSVTGPFGVELNGGEFLREAFTPCTPDGRDQPPAEIELAV